MNVTQLHMAGVLYQRYQALLPYKDNLRACRLYKEHDQPMDGLSTSGRERFNRALRDLVNDELEFLKEDLMALGVEVSSD